MIVYCCPVTTQSVSPIQFNLALKVGWWRCGGMVAVWWWRGVRIVWAYVILVVFHGGWVMEPYLLCDGMVMAWLCDGCYSSGMVV